jgi:hypothetical protein
MMMAKDKNGGTESGDTGQSFGYFSFYDYTTRIETDFIILVHIYIYISYDGKKEETMSFIGCMISECY